MQSIKTQFEQTAFGGFMKELLFHIKDDGVPQIGAMLAYHLMMSIFPFLIFLLNLLSFTPLGHVEVIGNMMEFLPVDTATVLQPILLDLIRSRSGALLSFSLVLALWSGSNAMMQIIQVMNRAFNLEDKRNFLVKRVLSVLYTVLLAVMILVTLLGPIFGDTIIGALFSIIGVQPFLATLWAWMKRLIPVITLILGFALMYRFAPGFPREKSISFREALIGAAAASIGWLVASFGFSYYVNNFGNYANTYGSLGGIIVLLIWLYLTSIMILIGAEISASFVFVKRAKAAQFRHDSVFSFIKEKEERTDLDDFEQRR